MVPNSTPHVSSPSAGRGWLAPQKDLCLGVVWQDKVCRTAQAADPVDQRRGNGGVGSAVVAHDRVDHLLGVRPEGKGFFCQSHLRFAAQITGVNAVKFHAQGAVMLQSFLTVGTAVQTSRDAKAACVGGKQHGGQSHGLCTHDGKYRQDHRKTAAPHAGKIVDTKNFFGFSRMDQIREPPCPYANGPAARQNIIAQYTTKSFAKKAYTRFFTGNNSGRDRIFNERSFYNET